MIEMKYPIGRFNGEPFAGIRGVAGSNGINGVDGEDGVSPTIRVGTVTSGPNPSVTNSGTEQNAIFDFVLPSSAPDGQTAIFYVKFEIDSSSILDVVYVRKPLYLSIPMIADKSLSEILDAIDQGKYPVAIMPNIRYNVQEGFETGSYVYLPLGGFCRSSDISHIPSYVDFHVGSSMARIQYQTDVVVDAQYGVLMINDNGLTTIRACAYDSIEFATESYVDLAVEGGISSIAVYGGVTRYPEET